MFASTTNQYKFTARMHTIKLMWPDKNYKSVNPTTILNICSNEWQIISFETSNKPFPFNVPQISCSYLHHPSPLKKKKKKKKKKKRKRG